MSYATIFDTFFGFQAFPSHVHGREAEKRKVERIKEEKWVFGEYLPNNEHFYIPNGIFTPNLVRTVLY